MVGGWWLVGLLEDAERQLAVRNLTEELAFAGTHPHDGHKTEVVAALVVMRIEPLADPVACGWVNSRVSGRDRQLATAAAAQHQVGVVAGEVLVLFSVEEVDVGGGGGGGRWSSGRAFRGSFR